MLEIPGTGTWRGAPPPRSGSWARSVAWPRTAGRAAAFFTAPGFCTERLTLFLATGLRETDSTPPDDELLEQSWLSLPEAMAAVDDGRVIDAKSVAGILWLAHRLAARDAPV